jgi:hypothetical protein
MKQIIVATLLSLAAASAFAQSATAGANSGSNSGALSSASVSDIGNSRANSNSGALSGSTATARTGDQSVNSSNGQQQQQGQISGQSVTFNSTSSDSVKTTGAPGAVSYGVSFSQFNCANTAAIGGGWLGGVLQLGGPLESGPCNARANAAALFQMAQTLVTTDPQRAAQLYKAAILLIGNSTTATQQALQTAGVKEWNPEPEKHSENQQRPVSLTQNCPANYCGNDPLIKARLGIQ